MTKPGGVVTCHWLAPTRIMPHPLCFEADARPWSCLRDGRPRPMNDLAFETWGIGIPLPAERTFDDRRRDVAWNTWRVETNREGVL